MICVDLLFGPFIKSSKAFESLFQRPARSDIEADESAFNAVAHARRRSKVSAVNLINQG